MLLALRKKWRGASRNTSKTLTTSAATEDLRTSYPVRFDVGLDVLMS